MYKDKDKQKEAARARQQKRRDAVKSKGVTISGRDEGVTIIHKGSSCPTTMAILNNLLTEELLALLPASVAKPTAQPGDPETGWWLKGGKYASKIHHLLTTSYEQLKAEDYWIPAWRSQTTLSIDKAAQPAVAARLVKVSPIDEKIANGTIFSNGEPSPPSEPEVCNVDCIVDHEQRPKLEVYATEPEAKQAGKQFSPSSAAVKEVEKILAPGDKLTAKAVKCIDQPVVTFKPKPQSFNPMMVGYEPPQA